ncbi:hypothetical protein E6P97_00455 [Patescibacteria group bacterium]|nr:MAG: hypothetical protein E6P97_00455 [Patescibacteria group bacterium]
MKYVRPVSGDADTMFSERYYGRDYRFPEHDFWLVDPDGVSADDSSGGVWCEPVSLNPDEPTLIGRAFQTVSGQERVKTPYGFSRPAELALKATVSSKHLSVVSDGLNVTVAQLLNEEGQPPTNGTQVVRGAVRLHGQRPDLDTVLQYVCE